MGENLFLTQFCPELTFYKGEQQSFTTLCLPFGPTLPKVASSTSTVSVATSDTVAAFDAAAVGSNADTVSHDPELNSAATRSPISLLARSLNYATFLATAISLGYTTPLSLFS